MPFLVRNLTLELDEPEEQLLESIAQRLNVHRDFIRAYSVVRRSLDARREARRAKSSQGKPHSGRSGRGLCFNYHVEVALDETPRKERRRLRQTQSKDVSWIEPVITTRIEPGTEPLPQRPMVIGFGPAGMFAALRLAEYGYQPIVYERGREVRRRHRDIMQRFYRERDFDPASNLLFGEGGAGTYSDGKLYTRVHDPLCQEVLETFYHHGADPNILIDARPHIGSDRLPTICTNIRRKIESLGGEVRFESCIDDIRIEHGQLVGISVNGNRLSTGPTVWAMGHSARDTIRMLASHGVAIEPKPFQIGVRIEHPQSMVDEWQYGTTARHARLAPAEYHMVAKEAACERGDVFSFCMCPGGMILPTNESPGLIATNGASRASRSSPFANSGLVMTLDPHPMGMNPLEALAFLERWERLAFQATGGSYRVPAQRASDYLSNRLSDDPIETSYPLGARASDIRTLIPADVGDAMERALRMLDAKFRGFAGPDALITAPETRASSPVRVIRDSESRQAQDIEGLYPVGEGAGYAGGIVSAAVDGLKTAHAVITRYAP